MMGFPAMGIDLVSDINALCTAAALYASCVAWTVSYDMVYGYMDIKDDVKVEIKSIALTHEHNTAAVMRGLGVAQIAFLAASEYFARFPWSLVLLHGALIHYALERTRKELDLKSVMSFQHYWNSCVGVVGSAIAFGLPGSYLIQTNKREGEESEESLLEKNSV